MKRSLIILMLISSCGKTGLRSVTDNRSSKSDSAAELANQNSTVPFSSSVSASGLGLAQNGPTISYELSLNCSFYGSPWTKTVTNADIAAGSVNVPKGSSNCYAYLTKLMVKPSAVSTTWTFQPDLSKGAANLFNKYQKGATEVYSENTDASVKARVNLTAPMVVSSAGASVGFEFNTTDTASQVNVNFTLVGSGKLTVNQSSTKVGITLGDSINVEWSSVNASSCAVYVDTDDRTASKPVNIVSNGPVSSSAPVKFGPLTSGVHMIYLKCSVFKTETIFAQVEVDVLIPISYQGIYSNDAGIGCIWIDDANGDTRDWALLGCNPAGVAHLGGPFANKITKLFSKGNVIRLRDWGALTAPADTGPYAHWRSTDNKYDMAVHMHFTRVDNADGTSTITGIIDDSDDGNCNIRNVKNFWDVYFKLEIPTQDYRLENIESSCSYGQ